MFPERLTEGDVKDFVYIGRGSTCPHHGEINGQHYVLKCGSYSATSSDEHVHNEFVADEILRAAGCNVPASREYRADIGHGKVETIRLSEYIEGAHHLEEAWEGANAQERKIIIDQIVKTYPIKSLIDDIDAYQHDDLDNVLIDSDWRIWFIDNGASFGFYARGGRKEYFFERTDIYGRFGYFSLRDATKCVNPKTYDQRRLRGLLSGVTDDDLRNAAAQYDFVALAKTLPSDYQTPVLMEYAVKLNSWARG